MGTQEASREPCPNRIFDDIGGAKARIGRRVAHAQGNHPPATRPESNASPAPHTPSARTARALACSISVACSVLSHCHGLARPYEIIAIVTHKGIAICMAPWIQS
ncbi:hypothetical protein RHMOL_Rhmol12G0090000 [Rhododendron molle]|uniref:Uncharacterized protein n=2 Tax=Rhododendron molle TaxID=49168 RepID=A0ACC0LGG6_RHOML|nr:hypothetical protein RHMOL_Rhmol12G0090000 [Rhododendron molle]KAI8527626.1 hypothetical protein RHMOL_Rhmol12G0090000 [Rhododendron molle]